MDHAQGPGELDKVEAAGAQRTQPHAVSPAAEAGSADADKAKTALLQADAQAVSNSASVDPLAKEMEINELLDVWMLDHVNTVRAYQISLAAQL